jgi:hypothetical protein
MDKLVRNWVIALSVGDALGVGLLALGVTMVTKNGTSPPNMLLCLVAGSFLGLSGWHWIRLLRGKVVFKTNRTLALNGGQIAFTEPACHYELWIFCRVSFAQYHGDILVTCGAGGNHAIKLPTRSPFLYPVRSNLVPIVWRPPNYHLNKPCECVITFHLSPTFMESVFDRRIHKDNVESMTLLIKTIN